VAQLPPAGSDPYEETVTPASADEFSAGKVVGPDRRAFRPRWAQLFLASALVALGLYWFVTNVAFDDLGAAVGRANLSLVGVALIVVLANTFFKTWRWQMMWPDSERRPTFGAALAALSAGQFANLVLPVRVGEIVRIYGFPRQRAIRKASVAGTLALEKSLEALTLLLSGVILLPFLVIPAEVTQSLAGLALGSVLLALSLLGVVWQSGRIGRVVMNASRALPAHWAGRIVSWVRAGLDGLAALRQWRHIARLTLISVAVLISAVATPWLMFRAFGLPLGLPEAVLLNLVVSLGLVPPSTPGKLLVFEAIVLVTLSRLGAGDDALLLGYALVYHLVVITPQIVLGGAFTARLGLSLSAIVQEWRQRFEGAG
jgi:uncharacterized protein (TIRG00374 family)